MRDYKNVTAKTESISAWDYIGAGALILTLILLALI